MTNRRLLAVIPARAGSKGLPGKNTMLLGGKPLIAWTIEAALGADCVSKVIVTTDSPSIAEAAVTYGAEVPFLRPAEHATDTASTADAVIHAIEAMDDEYDDIVLLQPTSPFREEWHIVAAFDLYRDSSATSVVSICEASKSPSWYFVMNHDSVIAPLFSDGGHNSRRQDLKKTFCLNGAIYIISRDKLLAHRRFIDHNTLGFIMDKMSSIDIDDSIDFKLAQALLGEK